MRLVLLALLAAAATAADPSYPRVYMTPADVARARDNAGRYPWARATANTILKEAATWLARDDDWYRQAVPPAGAAFAYGSTGCPICSATWGTWGGARASFQDPGHVTCTRGHRLPDAAHADPGTGYVAPDKRIHYFVGSYNAWAVETLTFKAADSLAYAYSLTGDDRYGAKASLILDALATIYPTCDKGSWDYPSNPPSGRFNRPWYQVARVLVHYVDFADQIWTSPSLERPSVKPGLTRRRNIELNLLRNGAEYCFKESQKGGLHNGEADYIRGSLAVGQLLDIPEYVRWAVDGPYGIYSLLANNIDRDGSYFETSMLYAGHTRGLYFSFAEPLFNLRSAQYPRGVNLYRDERFRRYFALHNLAQTVLGHQPRYGDSGPDTASVAPPARPFDRDDYDYLERLYARTGDSAYATALEWLAGPRLNELRGSDHPDPDAMGGNFSESRWMLFHGAPPPRTAVTLTPDLERRLLRSDLLGQKGIAILRNGPQALLFRYGPSLNHGHMDDLNINYFARGYELTYDLGYGNGATHTQVGWSKQTASHNLVLVDETSQLKGNGSGGSLHLFADLPGLKVVEASAESAYSAAKVSLYRRTLALIGEGDDAYLLDLFRVRGGRRHDYGFHALSADVDFDGVTPGPEQPGSLAGPEISWGDRQLNDGYLSGVEQKPYWVAPPGNGFGFLLRPRRAAARGPWSAAWRVDPRTRVRLHMPADPVEVVTALAPGILPTKPTTRYVLARRQGPEPLESVFAAVIEPSGERSSIRSVERLPVDGPASAVPAAAVRVQRADGDADYVFSAPDAAPRRAAGAEFEGRFAWVRVRAGKAIASGFSAVRRFRGFGLDVRARDAWTGDASAIDVAAHAVSTSASLPTDGSLNGHVIVFSNPRYTRNTAYRIERVEAAGKARRIVLAQSVVLGRGQVGKAAGGKSITTVIPHEYARTVTRTESGFFNGKRICTEAGACATVTGTRHAQGILEVDRSAPFQPGDVFQYIDLQAGDRFEIPLSTAK
jgi:hypothetical protein